MVPQETLPHGPISLILVFARDQLLLEGDFLKSWASKQDQTSMEQVPGQRIRRSQSLCKAKSATSAAKSATSAAFSVH